MDLKDKSIWEKELGVLPIKINPQEGENRYLMLNGGYSDFCMQTFDDEDAKLDEIAWSSSTKNFIKIFDDKILIRNWYENKSEEIKKDNIVSNFNQFYNYIFSKSYKTENDLAPFIIDIFRQLRNITLERSEPVEALNILFKLLISIDEDYNNIDAQKWYIEDVNLPDSFDYFVEVLRNGVRNAKPNLDIILRHSSGKIFQEANRNVLFFNPQRDLFGGASSTLVTQSIAYTSIHYTPQYLARTIVENCINNIQLNDFTELTILDPSCGSSEFLIEILKQLKNKNFTGIINIKGFDSSINAIETSKFLLHYENRTQWDNRININLRVVEDSLTQDWGINDIVLMNPPFTSFELIKDKEVKNVVRETLQEFIPKGKPNQASAFFLKSVNSLNQNGVIGCVLPSSIYTLDIYVKLRQYITSEIDLKLVGKMGNFVFDDALTDVSIFTGIKKETTINPTLIWTKNEKGVAQEALRELRKLQKNNEVAKSSILYSIYKPAHFPILDQSWRIISLKENKFISELDLYLRARKLIKLQDLFKVNQGALLGVKNIFEISDEQYHALVEQDQKIFRPLIDNSTVNNGHFSEKKFVWYPYNKTGLMIENEEDLHHYAFAQESLVPHKNKLQNRSGLKDKWWALTRPRNWQFESDIKLYSSRFGNSSSFGFYPKGNGVVVEGNAFVPKKGMSDDDLYFYLAIFSSDYFDLLLSIFSKELAGGKWYDLGNNFIKNIPLPNVHNDIIRNSSPYQRLVNIGKELSSGNSSVRHLSKNSLSFFYPEI
ncbi:N-6 DNA Methylase [Chryseobacterium taichungense]|uniref:site-specific DNA-methyltransferase (adenine-specific) n=1 Tax=Chryseobacterium taichungense TaxID=295069 RepID=A0A1H7WBX8_9FLAO|nr:N-6 DNA methylase [Chryseobacterium taichungense]SEM18585.1 N-6 DNA Methylase [Chryseobacterium taichungense]